MTETAQQDATDAQLLALPEHQVGELLKGELPAHPRSAPATLRCYPGFPGKSVGLGFVG
ncbi:MAG: hypothetical protein QNJ78_02700 [Gammaproteobacteria bacterium]|nr:hypothetical protein [Gammaproteobacteria bacterium]